MKEQKARSLSNTEFSVEFGDVNGMKLFDFPLASQTKHKKEPQKAKK